MFLKWLSKLFEPYQLVDEKGQIGGSRKGQKWHNFKTPFLLKCLSDLLLHWDTIHDSLSRIDWWKDKMTKLTRKGVYWTFSFKWYLIRIHWANFDNISQECSFGGPLSNVFNNIHSKHNVCCSFSRKRVKYLNCKILLL